MCFAIGHSIGWLLKDAHFVGVFVDGDELVAGDPDHYGISILWGVALAMVKKCWLEKFIYAKK